MRLRDKVAIITGAGKSQGRTATLMFCKEGAKVVAVGWHLDNVAETVRLAREAEGEAIASQTDIRKEDQVEKAVRLAVDTYGKLDILYNNAAVVPGAGDVTQMSERSLSFAIDVNLKGYFYFCKHAIPEMIKSGGGSIINISSNAVLIGNTGDDAYIAAKSGLLGLSRSIAAEFAAQNIRCNVILPGGVTSEGHKHYLSNPEILERMSKALRLGLSPMGRFGRQEEIVYCAVYLASDESTFTTGAEIVIDGGSSISRNYYTGDVVALFKGALETD